MRGFELSMCSPLPDPDVSIVIVSLNTRAILHECLSTLQAEQLRCRVQILVVDNASNDGSADMVQQNFPYVDVIRSNTNLGFGPANNVAIERAKGRFVILLNSDAFLKPAMLEKAVALMDENPDVGIGGARLMSRDGSWQPCGRMFPSPFNHISVMSGLSYRFPKSRVFGHYDRTWAPVEMSADVDWVVGAFMIVRSEVFKKIGVFDPSFFLYYEEVDFCRRARNAGFVIRYWADLRVVHACGESSRNISNVDFCDFGSQLTVWSMRSALLYFRKHHRWQARIIFWIETAWHGVRVQYHALRAGTHARRKIQQSRNMVRLMKQAWKETNGGRVSPPQPWSI